MRRRRSPEVIAGQMSSTGVLSVCSDSRVHTAKFSTGQFDITFPPDFKVLAVHVEGNSGTWVTTAVFNNPAGSQTWRLYTQYPAGTNADVALAFVAFGVPQ